MTEIGIRGVRILDPLRETEKTADILIRDGKIAAVGELPEDFGGRVLEASGLTAAPGFVDVHVHFRDPGLTYKEDILTGAAAAAAGGFTTVICMANTKPVVDNPETLSYVLEKGKETGIHVLSCACVTKGYAGKRAYRYGSAARSSELPALRMTGNRSWTRSFCGRLSGSGPSGCAGQSS